MSLHFIIDGYNLIKQTAALNKVNLKDSREALIRFITVSAPQGSKNNTITIVFDGWQGKFYYRAVSYLRIIFSNDKSADEIIKQLAEKSDNAKNIVVVTNDREVQFYARQAGAKVEAVEDFVSRALPKKNKAQADEKNVLYPIDAARITDELKKLWIKE